MTTMMMMMMTTTGTRTCPDCNPKSMSVMLMRCPGGTSIINGFSAVPHHLDSKVVRLAMRPRGDGRRTCWERSQPEDSAVNTYKPARISMIVWHFAGNKHWSNLQFAGYFDVAGEAAVEGSACTRAHLSAESIANHSRHRQRIQPAIHAVK